MNRNNENPQRGTPLVLRQCRSLPFANLSRNSCLFAIRITLSRRSDPRYIDVERRIEGVQRLVQIVHLRHKLLFCLSLLSPSVRSRIGSLRGLKPVDKGLVLQLLLFFLLEVGCTAGRWRSGLDCAQDFVCLWKGRGVRAVDWRGKRGRGPTEAFSIEPISTRSGRAEGPACPERRWDSFAEEE